jgi:phage tail-like protein
MSDVTAQPAAQPGTWKDPYRAYNFKLSFEDNITEGAFTEVSGLGAQIERIEFRPAGSNSAVLSVPGRVSYPPVSLRFGLTDSQVLWDWLVTAIDGNVRRRNTTITVQQPDGTQDAVRWHLSRAWPMAWAGAPLDTLSRQVAIETLTLAHEGITRENASATASSPAAAPSPPVV